MVNYFHSVNNRTVVQLTTRAFRFAIRFESIRIDSFCKKIGLTIHNHRVLYNE